MIRYDVLRVIRANPGIAGFLMPIMGRISCDSDTIEELLEKGLLKRIVEGVLVHYECTPMGIRMMSARKTYTRLYGRGDFPALTEEETRLRLDYSRTEYP